MTTAIISYTITSTIWSICKHSQC